MSLATPPGCSTRSRSEPNRSRGRSLTPHYAIAASATINRTIGDRRRWLGRAASRSAARALMAQRPARNSRELLQQVSYMVNQITADARARRTRATSTRDRAARLRHAETWLVEHPPVLTPSEQGAVDEDRGNDLEWTDRAPRQMPMAARQYGQADENIGCAPEIFCRFSSSRIGSPSSFSRACASLTRSTWGR